MCGILQKGSGEKRLMIFSKQVYFYDKSTTLGCFYFSGRKTYQLAANLLTPAAFVTERMVKNPQPYKKTIDIKLFIFYIEESRSCQAQLSKFLMLITS
jgi:hypothetical protein